MAHIPVAVVNPFEPFAHPSCHRFDGTYPQAWKTLEDSVDHHGGEHLTGVLQQIHREVHQTGLGIAIKITAHVVMMRNHVQPDRQVEVLRRRPHRIEIRVAEALALYRHRRDECASTSQFCHALELLDRERGFTNGNMRGRKKTLPMACDQIESPAVVGATQSVGQFRIGYLAFPDNSKARIDDLTRDSFGVEKARTRGHVLPIRAVGGVPVEGADRPTLLLLPIAAEDAEHFLDIAQPHRLAVHHHRSLVGHRVGCDPDGALTKAWFDVHLEQIEWLHEVAVPINDANHTGFLHCANTLSLYSCYGIDGNRSTSHYPEIRSTGVPSVVRILREADSGGDNSKRQLGKSKYQIACVLARSWSRTGCDRLVAIEHRVERDRRLDSRQRRTQTILNTAAEGDVAAPVTLDIELLCSRKYRGVAVGRSEAQRN